MIAPALSGPSIPVLSTTPVRPPLNRNIVIVVSVVVFHVAVLWGMQNGLLRRAAEMVMPAEILTRIIEIEPPKVAATPTPPPPPKPAAKTPKLPPPPMPVAIRDSVPTPNAPTGVVEPQPPASPIAAPVAPAPAPPAPPAAARVDLPMVDADYAANEEAFRPPVTSIRLREYGQVVLNVTVGINGYATHVELLKSSGYARLDNAAIRGAKRLKFRPAMIGGVPIEWTYRLPVTYSEPK